jgi:hypothetical protein
LAVAGTYALTAAENPCMPAYPTLTGRSVDYLLPMALVNTWC